jgi:hypothetical protein
MGITADRVGEHIILDLIDWKRSALSSNLACVAALIRLKSAASIHLTPIKDHIECRD